MKRIIFNITPIGKPRMVRSDTWAERPAVLKYWAFKEELNILVKQKRYSIGDDLNIVFRIPMLDSWSQKKKNKMAGEYHQQKPDIDNLLKAFTDCLMTDDSKIYKVIVEKYWATTGSIEVFV